LAYSYIRWSSTQQTSGDSLRRQTELAARYAERHNLQLDNTSFQDHGISAFKGKNVVEGRLGTFLTAIDEGVIQTPCYLLVEALDRLTRDVIDVALEMFLSIIKRGVTIVVLQSEQVFSRESIQKDQGISLIIAISMLVQGHEESAKRGKRVFEAWDNKREKMKEGVIASKSCPSWLKVVNGEFVVIPEKAMTVQRIFKLAMDGNGVHTIAKILNDEKVPTIGARRRRNEAGQLTEPTQVWTPGNISGLFRGEAVFGRWRRQSRHHTEEDFIDNYYPAIVSKEDYDAIKGNRRRMHWNGGFKQGTSNLFSGLTRCALCGGPLKYRGISPSRPHEKPSIKTLYLWCRGAMDHSGCKATKIPYLPFESDVLSYLINWQLMDLNPQEMERKNVTARRAVEQQLLGKEEELEALVNVIALSKSSPEILARRIDETQAAIDKLRTELKNMSSARLSEQDLRDNAALFLQLMEGSDQDFRKKVQVALRRQIKKVEVAGNVFSLTYVDGTIATSDFHWIGWQADINLGQPDLE
jgi:DNA invertase Pin-like site-specific DNA recombinase